jgi:hypothetical protein
VPNSHHPSPTRNSSTPHPTMQSASQIPFRPPQRQGQEPSFQNSHSRKPAPQHHHNTHQCLTLQIDRSVLQRQVPTTLSTFRGPPSLRVHTRCRPEQCALLKYRLRREGKVPIRQRCQLPWRGPNNMTESSPSPETKTFTPPSSQTAKQTSRSVCPPRPFCARSPTPTSPRTHSA